MNPLKRSCKHAQALELQHAEPGKRFIIGSSICTARAEIGLCAVRLLNHQFTASLRHVCIPLQGFEAFDAAKKGTWAELPTGGAALRLNIRSPGTGSHVVVFRCGKTSGALVHRMSCC